MQKSSKPIVEFKGISKSFGSATALKAVDLKIEPGEIHALVGENGAGKSTLIRILAGDHLPDAGEIFIRGKQTNLTSPSDAIKQGVGFVHQIPAFVEGLSITENVLLGQTYPKKLGVVDWTAAHKLTAQALGTMALRTDPKAPLSSISAHARQSVAIARALLRAPHTLVLDEVTASLSEPEVRLLLDQIRQLRARGASIIYVSHRLEEIFRVADRVTVLRDGKNVATLEVSQVRQQDVVAHIVGKAVPHLFDRKTEALAEGETTTRLRVRDFGDDRLRNVNFDLRNGEILGLGGLGSSGRTRLLRMLFAAKPRTSGKIWLDGEEITPKTVPDALALGFGMVTEDRNDDGYVQSLPVWQNISLPWLARFRRLGVLDTGTEMTTTAGFARSLRVKTPSMHASMSALSGGNQQKVLFARWADANVRVLLLDEPTHGVDIGSKAQIYDLIMEMARRGTSIIVASSELEELEALCHRVLILREGTIAAELSGNGSSNEAILHRILNENHEQGLVH